MLEENTDPQGLEDFCFVWSLLPHEIWHEELVRVSQKCQCSSSCITTGHIKPAVSGRLVSAINKAAEKAGFINQVALK